MSRPIDPNAARPRCAHRRRVAYVDKKHVGWQCCPECGSGRRINGRGRRPGTWRMPTPGRCFMCGCTDERACDDGCGWWNLQKTICTACAPASVS